MIKTVTVKDTIFEFNMETGLVTVLNGEKKWKQNGEFEPDLVLFTGNRDIAVKFSEAVSIKIEPYKTGVSEGIRTIYSGFRVNGDIIPMVIETRVWVHNTSGRLYFELIPLNEPLPVKSAAWPSPWEWNEREDEAYSVFPMMQGVIIPSNWPHEVRDLGVHHFCSKGAYMPWFGQVSHNSGYLQIAETPYDCGYYLHHNENGPTEFYINWKSSLGQIGYKRVLRTDFFTDCDYNTLCKSYRQFVKERGRLITLKQKEAANPSLEKLYGSPVIHSYIYYKVKPEAYIYDKNNPDKNYRFATFEQRKNELIALTQKGLDKAYLHLDGWGVDGYDWRHPDIMPPCEKAGGAEKMKELADTCRDLNILFALHDQYRDYYIDAETYSEENAVHNYDGSVRHECTWNGGDQSYLCASSANYYVERNYGQLESLGIIPDGVYMDVFAATVPDECFQKEHTMTRRECVAYRAECLEYFRAKGIIISSEEAVDIMLPHMDLVHHAPYPNLYMEDDFRGIPVPLTNLVYHDCLITPWVIKSTNAEKISDDTLFLTALLNGGTSYISIDADDAELDKVKIITHLHYKVAKSEMTRHEFLNKERTIQRTSFSNGLTVTVDFSLNTYEITEVGE